MNSSKISAYCMVYNSVKWIKQTLDNIYPVFNEIVIVEGRSTDGTLEIIENYPDPQGKVKLFIIPQKGGRYDLKAWNQPFRRNFAMEQCTGDWIFMIDSDETLTPELIDMLPGLVASSPPHYLGYRFAMKNLWKSKDQYRIDGRWWPCWRFRLWRNIPGWEYETKPKHCKLLYKGKLITDYPGRYKDIDEACVLHWHYTALEVFRSDGTMVNSDNEVLRTEIVQVQSMGKSKKIVFLAENAQPHIYYGGRIYNRFLLEALNDIYGEELVYYTNTLPRFFDEVKGKLNVKYVKDAFFTDLPRLLNAERFIGAPLTGGIKAIEAGGKEKRTAYAIIYDPPPLVRMFNIQADKAFFARSGWQRYFKLMQQRYVKVIVISQYQKKMVAEWLRKPESDVIVLEPCVDERVFDFRARRTKKKKWISYIGRIHERKNLGSLFEIWKEFDSEYELHVITSTVLLDWIKRVLDQHKTIRNVVWHLNADDEMKFQILSQSRLFINPAIFEGFGMWMIEAMACGTPIVCFDFPVFKAINEDQSAVFYAKYKDNRDFIAKMKEALQSNQRPVLRNHWYKNFRIRVRDIFEKGSS